MAKKLVYNSTFTPGAAGSGTIVVKGNFPLKVFQLITNVTDGVIIYNFADPTRGGSTSYESLLNETTLTLDFDTSSMDASDSIQIFLDKQEQKVDFSETFTDPVSKLRVSNPQNLIDTDFEYGLQPTKWETVELVNNVPSFFASNTTYSIADVTNVRSLQGSENITVTTQDEHGLTVGAPIDVQGLTSRTAEGKFLVSTVISTTKFVYKAKTVQSVTKSINGSYTVITPGEFYSGADIQINPIGGIETDGAAKSSLTLETDYHHGFGRGSSLYFTNTIGARSVTITNSTTATAPDGRPYVDYENVSQVTSNVTSSLTETKQMTGMYAHKFTGSSVNTTNNTITWSNHQLAQGDILLYVPPAGDTAIGGLQRFQIYMVRSAPTSSTITLQNTSNSIGSSLNGSTINLTSQGTSNYGRHQLILGYQMYRGYKRSYSYEHRYYHRYYAYSSGSGRDIYSKGYTYDSASGRYGYFGLMGAYPERFIFATRQSFNPPHYMMSNSGAYYSQGQNYNFTFGKSGTQPDGYDFIEDFERFNANTQTHTHLTGNNNTDYYFDSRSYMRFQYLSGYSYYYSSYNYYFNSSYNQLYWFGLKQDPERDTLYVPNHGLDTNARITLNTTSGSNISYRTDGTNGYYYYSPSFSTISSGSTHNIEKVSNNRIRIKGKERIRSASGTYSITGDAANPTKNTFYSAGHDFTNNQKLLFSSTGTIPTTLTNTLPDTSSIDTVFDKTDQYMASMITAMGNDSTNLYYSSSTPYRPFYGYDYVDGYVQYMYYSMSTIYQQSPQGTLNEGMGHTTNRMSRSMSNFNTQLRGSDAWDPFTNYSIVGKGYYLKQTPFVAYDTIPYYITVYQIPDLSIEGKQTSRMYMSGWFSNYGPSVYQGYESNTMQSIGDGWRYTYETNYGRPNNSYHGLLCMTVNIDNTNWPGYYNTSSFNMSYSGSDMNNQTTTYGGQRYMIQILLPIRGGTSYTRYGPSGSVRNNATMALGIANNIKNAFTAPQLSAGTVYAKPINSNRFALQTASQVEYDFTNAGTSPFTFTTEEETGTLDGYYSVDTVTDTTIGNFSKFEIPQRIFIVGHADVVTIGSNIYFNSANNKMRTSQKIVYTSSGGSISNLTSGDTYYVISDGPDHFRVAETPEDATAKIPISINNPSAGTFTFTTPSIAGISSAIGTLQIESNMDTKVTGTGTLFKRFLRTGDEFTIRDHTRTPPVYRNIEIASVIDDQELTLTAPAGITTATGNYYVETKVNTRPDGAFLHRPFDGGVEIDAGTSPNSSIVRQTRKYFRYQSGKGIQCSVAINFNPSRIINTMTADENTTLPTQTYTNNVNNNGSGSYNISGDDRDGRVLGENSTITVTKGDTLILEVNASGHPLWVKAEQSTGNSNPVTTGITNNGTDSGTITWDTTSVTAGTYYYNCENHASMNGVITVEDTPAATTIATATTIYPHGLTRGNTITVKGSNDTAFNGSFDIQGFTEFTFSYYLTVATSTTVPDGIISYNIDSWANSAVRCGLFDYQNGMFFEFDGSELYTVRRSSVQQLTGTVNVTKGSNIMTGENTNFSGQLNRGGRIVIRGGSYKITNIPDKTTLHIQPAYKGVSALGVIATKTEDIRVPQSQWNIDKADGTGPSGFVLDLTKIQMAYIDYSWYGAGKIRFGFKDANGHVKYMNEFLHNNIIEEAYMRSGNIPGRYEIENTSDVLPTYVPSLFHWGTSVIMDGRFDDDKAYLFTASSASLNFTNGDSNSANTTSSSSLIRRFNYNNYNYDWYVRIPFSASDASKFSNGVTLYTANGALDGQTVSFTEYSGSTIYVFIFIASRRYYQGGPAVYPSVGGGVAVSIGAPASGGETVDLQNEVPLISIRLAPSVDNNLTGTLGQREIVNRMQLQLKQLGITLTHDCTVDLILNGEISKRDFKTVTNPSLSELVVHDAGDRIIGGTKIFSLRASGGQENAAGTRRLSATSDFDISQISDLGNSILGGDGTFPNGPDLLTIAIIPIDTSDINATTPLKVSSRITWTESQA